MNSRTLLQLMLAVAALLMLILTTRAEDEVPAPPWAEEYFARQNLRQYLLDAEAYITSHPDSPYLPQVAFEAMMAASVEDRDEPFQAMRRRLLFDYPKSLQASYVNSTFDAKTYAEFLEKDLTLDVLRDTAATERRLEGISNAFKKWGGEIFKKDDVLLQVAIVAQRHGDYRLATVCEQALGERKGNVAEVAAIVFDRSAATPEKFVRLSEREKEDRPARIARQLLFMNFSAEERLDPAMMRIGMADLIEADYWDAVLETADAFLAQSPDDCRARYWRAWALCGLGERHESLAAAKELQAKFPDDPWAKVATSLIKGIESRDATVDSLVAFKEFLSDRGGLADGVEAWLEATHGGHRFTGYVAGNAKGKHIEAVVRIDESVILAIRLREQDVAVYFAGDPTIQVADSGAFPILKLKVDEATRKISFYMGVTSVNRGIMVAVDDAKSELAKLAKDRETLASIADRMLARGAILLPIEIAPSEVVVQYAQPCIHEPNDELTKIQIIADEEKFHTEFETAGQFSLKLNIPTTEKYQFSPPAWPNVPESKVTKLDLPTLLRGIAAVWKAYQEAWPSADFFDEKTVALPKVSVELGDKAR